VAAPFVSASEDGTSLKIVAPGVVVASREQTAWFGGAEVEATFGAGVAGAAGSPGEGAGGGEEASGGGAPTGEGLDSGTSASGVSAGGVVGAAGADGEVSTGIGPGGEPIPAEAAGTEASANVSVRRFETGLPFVLIVGAGLIAALWIVARWMRQFPVGSALSYYPPFSLIDRLYRTFAKS
jgi:hypothetical protein